MDSERGPITTVKLPFYTPEEFELLRGLNEGDEVLHDTYEEWKTNTADIQKTLESEGLVVKRINMDVVAVIQWCHDRGFKFDGPARAKFLSQAST